MKTAAVLVIGCGVSGLTSGIRLLEEGFKVTILAREVPPNTTSDKAAAIWYPYDIRLDEAVKQWCKTSHARFVQLTKDEASGVANRPSPCLQDERRI